MPDPITTAIATAVAGSVATSMATEATRILEQITARIRDKLRGRSRGNPVPADPANEPDAADHAASLAAQLHHAFQQDPAFARELTALWQDYQEAAASTVNNTFHGNANNVVQLRDMHGNLNIS